MQLGQRIRDRRLELNLSLRELAEQVSLTASFLSQIERDLASPSIESLGKISEALEVPIFYFLVDSNGQNPVVKCKKRIKVTRPDSSRAYELLVPDLNRKMEAILVEREPGEEEIITEPLRQYTEEFAYILQGQLEIQLGDKVYVLGAGDSIYFEGPLLRRLTTRGDETLRYISVITPPVF
jgi:transcriptional regulator with XRE-family HTH domain